MSILHRVFGLLVSAALLAACGQKGPLYLPGNPSEVRTEIPAGDNTPAGEEDSDEEREEDPEQH